MEALPRYLAKSLRLILRLINVCLNRLYSSGIYGGCRGQTIRLCTLRYQVSHLFPLIVIAACSNTTQVHPGRYYDAPHPWTSALSCLRIRADPKRDRHTRGSPPRLARRHDHIRVRVGRRHGRRRRERSHARTLGRDHVSSAVASA
jgi:hypothetical protein